MFEVVSFESDRKRKSDGKIREDSQDPVGHGTLDTESGAVSYLVNTWKQNRFISEYCMRSRPLYVDFILKVFYIEVFER